MAKFKKGQSGNPKGRPRGTRNRATIVKKWLETSERVKNPVTGEMQRLQQQDIMTLALIKEARKGNVKAYTELMNSAYGKALETIEVTDIPIETIEVER